MEKLQNRATRRAKKRGVVEAKINPNALGKTVPAEVRRRQMRRTHNSGK